MVSGLRYRLASVGGTVLTVVLAVLLANHAAVQQTSTTLLPVVSQLEPQILAAERFTITILATATVVTASLVPLFKPRPRRILDIVFVTEKRVLIACFALATIGYFDYTYRLPRSTLIVVTALLGLALPLWFVTIRRPPVGDSERAIVVGDDIDQIGSVLETTSIPVLGYVSPPNKYEIQGKQRQPLVADGWGEQPFSEVERLGGLSRLEEVLVENDINTTILAFSTSDRAEFFGALDTCYKHGVTAKAHREHTDSVLTRSETTDTDELVDIALEPWDWQDYLFKRIFDVTFAAVSLAVFAPVLVVIALAIKLDSPGPVFYSQERTAELGDTFPVYKFRTMLPDSESAEPEEDEDNDRITRVGRVLRKTHLDELPQLWTILTGKMSVVGPRAVWTDEEPLLEAETKTWRKRWFVKPGLTGLAQIHDAKSTSPKTKLRYDLEYIRRQSFWFDLKIVARQIWQVAEDTVRFTKSDGSAGE
ncbi:sugar transferase [Haladaptatus salinisoli]|uniref:sugar transferase n=1 Tax=Haladaptatus salinisoli TaxID=2884876 RepID=UPI001D09D4E0|nr:sugar transferase [Haladaptatus salinisoli]